MAPVDGALSLPPMVCSALVRETAEELGVGEAYHKGLALSTRTLQEQVAEDAPEVEAAILVLQADGKGVPIVRPPATGAGTPAPAPVRLGKGQKRGGKKEAMLTAVYTIAPAVRTPEEVVESLFRAPSAERATGSGRCARGRVISACGRPWRARTPRWTRPPPMSRGATGRTSPTAWP